MRNAPTTTVTSLILRADSDENSYHGQLETLRNQDLPIINSNTDVLVTVEYSSLNDKDAQAITASAPVARRLPRIPGINLVGQVLASQHPAFSNGDPVLATGWDMGEKYHGGLSQRTRVAADWLVLPPALWPPRCTPKHGNASVTSSR